MNILDPLIDLSQVLDWSVVTCARFLYRSVKEYSRVTGKVPKYLIVIVSEYVA